MSLNSANDNQNENDGEEGNIVDDSEDNDRSKYALCIPWKRQELQSHKITVSAVGPNHSKDNNNSNEIAAVNALAENYYLSNDYRNAMSSLQKVLRLHHQGQLQQTTIYPSNDSLGIAQTLYALGILNAKMNDYESAIVFFREALHDYYSNSSNALSDCDNDYVNEVIKELERELQATEMQLLK
eukprot:CAMPEP_0171315242 /NCGR_PEP_ID=MMETSP0816-20121228/61626_1 /TAXON_ID=420281 /ORGANISM="Proboscia inermis, Strain CCAP1064/1" /LENGTH=183 /DNA_ID=CAMNT_0011805475 /DNA_START=101 /DNA_END=652 /DNA_ORIENTATION=+